MEELRAEDPKRVGPFESQARLGTGAMGQVYLGERPGGERTAVKVIYESLTGVRRVPARKATNKSRLRPGRIRRPTRCLRPTKFEEGRSSRSRTC